MAKSRRAPDDDLRRRAEEDDDDAPRRKGRRADEDEDDGDDGPIKPRRKKKSAAGPTKFVLRIIGAVLLAVAVIIFLVWVYSPVGADHSMLCYFPKETTRLSGYDVDEGMKNAQMNDVHELLIGNYKQLGDNAGRPGTPGSRTTDVSSTCTGRPPATRRRRRTCRPRTEARSS